MACAVALKNLEIMEREGLVDRVSEDTGPYFAEALHERIAGHPLVGEVRSVGLMGAIEIVKDKATRERFQPAGSAAVIVRDHAIANGMMLRATGDTMILSPPLIWTRETIDHRLFTHRQGARSGPGGSEAISLAQNQSEPAMSGKPIVPLIEYEHASDEARAVYDDIMATRKSEWVNNFWKVLAHDPVLLKAHMGEHKAGDGAGRARSADQGNDLHRVSATNGCDYCTYSHTASARAKGLT